MHRPVEQTVKTQARWIALAIATAVVIVVLSTTSPLVALFPAWIRDYLSVASDTHWYALSGRDFLLAVAAFSIPILLFARRHRQLGEARRALKEREDQFEAYSKAALDWFWETDENHRVTLIFGGAVSKKNLDPSRYVGKTRQDLAGAAQVEANAEAWAEHQALLDRHEPFRGFEYEMIGAEGKLLTVSVSGAPLFDDDGRFKGYRGTGTDITALKRATEGSRTSEAQLWSIINNAPLLVLLKDTDGRFIHVNKMACEAFGASEDDLLGKTKADIFPAEVAAQSLADDRYVLEHLAPRRREFRFETCDGSREFLSVKFPVLDRDGEAVGLGAIMMDITDRKEQERALRESEARLRDFAISASDWFWETDANLRLARISGRFDDGSDHARQYAIGKTRIEIASADDVARNPERWTEHQAMLERREPFRSFEFEIETASGERRIISTSGVPVFDEDGTFTGYRGGATDVTEHRKAEREAAAALEQLEFLANNVPALIAYVDRDGRFQLVNREAEAWYARPREEIVGRHIKEIFDADSLDVFEPFYRDVFAGREVSCEQELTYPDGKTRRVNVRWVPRMRDGAFDGFVGLVVDVTEQHALQDTLRQSQKMEALGQLTGGVAHDFNNLLLAIQGNLELLREEFPETAPVQRFVSNSLHGVGRAADLTRRLLAFSRRQPFSPEPVRIDSLVEDLQEMLSRILEELIGVRVETNGGKVVAMTDRGQLENAILNLAINARDAMPDGGSLTVTSDAVTLDAKSLAGYENARPGRYARIAITDTGGGMTPEVRRRACEPFFTTKDIGAGTGLGLSMVHGFAEQSEGFVTIDSEVGEGTTISLFLPLTDERPGAACGPARPAPAGGKGRILLVEDEALVREVNVLALNALGYTVTEAANGIEALQTLQADSAFDLLFTDIVMPGGLSGVDLVERARQLRPGIKAIMATGHASPTEQPAFERIPDVPILRKPFSRDLLARSIEDLLADAAREPSRARTVTA